MLSRTATKDEAKCEVLTAIETRYYGMKDQIESNEHWGIDQAGEKVLLDALYEQYKRVCKFMGYEPRPA